MATHPDYPGCSSFKDRHGRERWRYRAGRRTVSLPGAPGDPDFEPAYLAALSGQPATPAVVPLPGGVLPKTMADGWRRHKASPDWRRAKDSTRKYNEGLAYEFLGSEVAKGSGIYWRDVPVEDLRRSHVKAILNDRAETPHKAKHILVVIRKIVLVALDEEWIENDPTVRIKWRPAYRGFRAWTPEELRLYFKHWKVGTTPHLAAMLALWLGHRRSDLARLSWADRTTRTLTTGGVTRIARGFEIETVKGGKPLFSPEAAPLTAALDAATRNGPTVLVTSFGKPFSHKGLTTRMREWTHAAGLPSGCTLHGLRKTLGKRISESGGTTRQSMAVLGHEDMAEAELYSREAERIALAVEAMERVASVFGQAG